MFPSGRLITTGILLIGTGWFSSDLIQAPLLQLGESGVRFRCYRLTGGVNQTW
jgi:hypothetical protein